MKKFLYFFLSVVIIVLISKVYQSSLPEYNPKRDYVDLENEILKAFILAEDNSTIELCPSGNSTVQLNYQKDIFCFLNP